MGSELESIQPLSKLNTLCSIYLDSTNIQDIESLSKLENLKRLHIEGNTSERVKEQAELYFSHVEMEIRE